MGHAMLANGAREITPSPGRPGAGPQRQDRLPPRAARMHRLRRGAGRPEADAAADRRRAQAVPRPGERLPGRQHDAGRHHARHRGPGRRRARAADRRQDRHDQRLQRQLVHRLHARLHGRHLCRLRRAAHAWASRRPAAAPRRRSTSASPSVLFKDKPPVPFRIPPGLRIVRVDHDSGLPSSRRATRSTRPSSPAPSPTNRIRGCTATPDGSAPVAGIDSAGRSRP